MMLVQIPIFLALLSFSTAFNVETWGLNQSKPEVDDAKLICSVCVGDTHVCDPTWLPEPNLNRALVGIDITKKVPMPLTPGGDPSTKGKTLTKLST